MGMFCLFGGADQDNSLRVKEIPLEGCFFGIQSAFQGKDKHYVRNCRYNGPCNFRGDITQGGFFPT